MPASGGERGSSSRVQQERVAAIQPGDTFAVDEGDGNLDAVGGARPQALRLVVGAAEAAQHRLHLLRLPAGAQPAAYQKTHNHADMSVPFVRGAGPAILMTSYSESRLPGVPTLFLLPAPGHRMSAQWQGKGV